MKKIFLIALLLAFAFPAQCKECPTLVFSGPPIAESVPLIAMTQGPKIWKQPFNVKFIPWHSPDMLRAMIVGGQIDAAIITTAAAATLLNKGVKVRIAQLYESPVWIVSRNPGPDTLESLKGTLLFPFGPGEMPELFFKATIGNKPNKITIRHTSGALEAVNLLLAGKGDHAMLSEPTASVAIQRSQEKHANGSPLLVRRISMGKAWTKTFPGHRLAATSMTFFGAQAARPDLIQNFRKAHTQACEWVKQNPSEALYLTQQEFPSLATQLHSGAIKEIDIHALNGQKAQKNALFFLSKIKELSPAAIGGPIPNSDLFEVKE
ncbi:ABC transporter substrate-binding protein [Maridesulfovibrio salexigens]|uniref:ABC-type nitrate/sulfonate/bicarbonate transport systems periplasmic components-like protein n=1 Tax=Maridesulfovibrio salexigens (strain ATCC 14822 / DSM 2638 / NCIMB 8403 / VKM B-1763) TaxID=526222 RepID=C6BUC8_MARSD|nr:ABC transporter substrate-binding protein [Maridesulfovibrio salexigens]ACS79937.1 ABC-type nitrate/sulfonate/bicarbonate transport systems periplasmic components-like protein [Maridesulfovibrio salexigens DSM 2638]